MRKDDPALPVDANCPGRTHNTLRAARRQPPERCLCPYSLLLIEKRRVREREIFAQRYRVGKVGAPKQGRPIKSSLPESVHMPNLLRGACVTDAGRLVMEAMMTRHADATTRAAKRLCHSCPVRRECLTWALAAERPVGSWEGMYGGMTAEERRKYYINNVVKTKGNS